LFVVGEARRLSITQPTLLSQLPEPLKFVVDSSSVHLLKPSLLFDLMLLVYKAKAARARAITLPAMKLEDEIAAPSNSGRVLLEMAPVVAAAMPPVALAAPVVVG
jgi:hypothetical protein